jgi:lipopolysaccharide export LptBFGC system permease protein LptF
MSLKRVVVPILLLSLISTGLLVIDQEFLIPAVADKLVRSPDYVPGRESYDVWFITDDNGSLICSQSFDVKTSAFLKPTIILRRRTSKPGIWEVTGKISADRALYNDRTRKWDLINGQFIDAYSLQGPQPVASYDTGGLAPRDISIRRSSAYKNLLSSRQLAVLTTQAAKIKDIAQLYSQKHFRITDPIINLAMLMVSLPVLVCRDPKAIKSAVLISFALTGLCFVTAFVCKMFATEVIFDRVMPEMWAWLPVFIFVPLAFIELDSMKT